MGGTDGRITLDVMRITRRESIDHLHNLVANDHCALVVAFTTARLRRQDVESCDDLFGLLRQSGKSPYQFQASSGIAGLRP